MFNNSNEIHVLLVPGRGDTRRRHRFLEKPLIRKGIKVTVAEVSRRSSQYLVEAIRRLRGTANATHVIFIGGDWTNLILILIYRLFSNSIILVRFGGHPTESRWETAKAQLNAKQYWGSTKSLLNLISTVLLLRIVHGAINVSAEACKATNGLLTRRASCFNIPQSVSLPSRESINVDRTVSSTINLLTVANLDYQTKMKGVVIIGRGIQRMTERVPLEEMPLLHWRIAGGGRYLDEMKHLLKRVEFKTGIKVDVLGHVNDVKPLYEEADIFIYCSWLEGLPNVLLEAMSLGLPIIVNRYYPFYDILVENQQALYFDQNTLNGFDTALISLVKNRPLRGEMGTRNIAVIEDQYSDQAIGKKLFGMLKLFGKSLNLMFTK